MKYRIVEFKIPEDTTGDLFFVETGKVIWKKLFWFVFYPHTVWEKDLKEIHTANEIQHKPIGHKTIESAIERIEQIKDLQPKYHEIK